MTVTHLVVDREDVAAKRWEPFGSYAGVRHKVLWRDTSGGSFAGLMRLDPGAHIPTHSHDIAVHHGYVVEGVVGAGGEALGPGSYFHVPAGVEHDVWEVGLEGCTLFYLYLAAV